MVKRLDRRAAVRALLADRGDLLVVSGLGSPTYDLHAAGDHPGNFYTWGAMGGAALIGLGVALAQPARKVLVITGDGEQLMGLGGLATIAVAAPANLAIVVLDNGRFGETGQQESHTGRGLDLVAVAGSCGFKRSQRLRSLKAVTTFGRDLARLRRLSFAVIEIDAENPPRSLPSRDAVLIKHRFRAHLGLG